jgi:hypothetical protein
LTARSRLVLLSIETSAGTPPVRTACSSCTIQASPPGSDTDSTSMPVSSVNRG